MENSTLEDLKKIKLMVKESFTLKLEKSSKRGGITIKSSDFRPILGVVRLALVHLWEN